MNWFDLFSYAVVGTSSSISAVQIARWVLNANPQAVIMAGRWSKFALLGLTPVVLLWLVMTDRSLLAMMLAAFTLPIFVQSGLHWLARLGAPNAPRSSPPWWDPSAGYQDFATPVVRRGFVGPAAIDLNLARQSAAVLKAYMAQTAARGNYRHSPRDFVDDVLEAAPTEWRRRAMSTEEARAILGTGPAADPCQVSEAHRRLRQKLAPELGETNYLTLKIDEARDVLLEEWGAALKND
jgi:hypothetical protein